MKDDCKKALFARIQAQHIKDAEFLEQAFSQAPPIGQVNMADQYSQRYGTAGLVGAQTANHPAIGWYAALNRNAVNVLSFVLPPDQILPEGFIKPLQEAIGNWHSVNQSATMAEKRMSYFKQVVPALRQAHGQVDALPDSLQQYAREYLNNYLNGGEFFEAHPGSKNVALKTVETLVSNPVTNNVVLNTKIAALNTLEWLPKTLAEHGPLNTLNAIRQVVGNTKGGIWTQIPELADAGIYMSKGAAIDPLAWTETFNRGIYYYAGKGLTGSGDGVASVEKLGYLYRPGNAPALQRVPRSQGVLRLMSYTIGNARMLANWAYDVSGRVVTMKDGQLVGQLPRVDKMATGAMALGTWAVAQTLMTGVESTGARDIVNALPLSDEDKNTLTATLDEIDQYGNWVGKTTDVQLGSYMKPGGVTLGVGYEIFNQAAQNIQRGAEDVSQGLANEDQKQLISGVLDLATNALMLAKPTNITVGNKNIIDIGAANYKKAAKLVKQMILDQTVNMEDPEQVKDTVIGAFVGRDAVNDE